MIRGGGGKTGATPGGAAEVGAGRARPGVLIALFILTAGLVAASLWVHAQSAQQRAVELVMAAQEARNEVASAGTVVIRSAGLDGPQGVRAHVHRGAGRTAIRYLDGPVRDARVFREGGQVWRGRGSMQRSLALEWGTEVARLNRDLLARNYVARIVGQESVAGRSAVHVGLRRRDGGGGLHLWLDRDTHLPLRTVVVDHAGRAVSDTTYESIDYEVEPPRPPASSEGAREPRLRVRPVTAEEARREAGFQPLRPMYLPRGFELAGRSLHRLRGGRGPAVELRYTDGLAVLSVIQMRASERRVGSGRPRGPGPGGDRHPHRNDGAPDRPHVPRKLEGPRGGGGKVVREHGDVTVMVIGDLPPAELERVAGSMR